MFDDLIFVEKAAKEHQELYDILHYFTDGNCYEFIDLLKIVISEQQIKVRLIDECIELEKLLYNNKIDKTSLIKLNMVYSSIIVLLQKFYLPKQILVLMKSMKRLKIFNSLKTLRA